MKKIISILVISFFAFCFSAKAQHQKTEQKPTVVNNNRLLTEQNIPVNPADTVLMRRILLIINPAMFIPDPTAKIYTKEERDSIVKMVEGY